MCSATLCESGAEALAALIAKHGLKAVAAGAEVSYQAIQKWVRNKRVPIERQRCLKLELAFPGEISRSVLRPDVYGTAPPAIDNLREAS